MKHFILSLLIMFVTGYSYHSLVESPEYKTINLNLAGMLYKQRKSNQVGEVGESVSMASDQDLSNDLPMDYYKERDCLASALFHEARGESDRGIALVAQVIINRVNSKGFPDTVCKVINQRLGKTYQFSYLHRKNLQVKELKAYEKVVRIATLALEGKYRLSENTLFYKRCDVDSEFFDKLEFNIREKDHCFYKLDSNS